VVGGNVGHGNGLGDGEKALGSGIFIREAPER
jgi:hypothetical protein